jgi:hypothetical protein
MSNEKVILEFLEGREGKTSLRNVQNGYYIYKGRTLYTSGNYLINYSTKIAKLENNKLYLNIRKYSVTTSKIQSKIRYLASQKGYEIIEVDELN